MQTSLCVGVDDGGKILSARQIRDPEAPNYPAVVVAGVKPLGGGDIENTCRRTSLPTPAKAYTPGTRKGQRG